MEDNPIVIAIRTFIGLPILLAFIYWGVKGALWLFINVSVPIGKFLIGG